MISPLDERGRGIVKRSPGAYPDSRRLPARRFCCEARQKGECHMSQSSSCGNSKINLLSVLRSRPQAAASITGSEQYPDISGTVRFYQTNKGVVVWAEISGLPHSALPCQEQIFGFHIHQGTTCTGNMDDPFADTMSHYNPGSCEHPYHAGDMPPLFGNNGFALSLFLTDRFSINEVIGKTVIIHDHPDDFTTQPSGNSGTKIACGVVQRAMRSCQNVLC